VTGATQPEGKSLATWGKERLVTTENVEKRKGPALKSKSKSRRGRNNAFPKELGQKKKTRANKRKEGFS